MNFDYSIYEYRKVKNDSELAEKIRDISFKNYKSQISITLLKIFVGCIGFMLLFNLCGFSIEMMSLMSEHKYDWTTNSSYSHYYNGPENVYPRVLHGERDLESLRLASERYEERYKEKRSILIKNEITQLMFIFLSCLLIEFIAFVISLIKLFIFRYVHRDKNIYVTKVIMVQNEIVTRLIPGSEELTRKDYYIMFKEKHWDIKDAIMKRTDENHEKRACKVYQKVFRLYEPNKEAYLVRWLKDGIDDTLESDSIERDFELIIF